MKRTVVILIGGLLSMMSCKNNQVQWRPAKQGQDTCFSKFIPIDSANKMIGSYLKSIEKNPDSSLDLQSVIIDVNQLRRYIDSMPGSDSITNIKLMFAHTLDYINAGNGNKYAGYQSGKFTLIISAYSANGNYIYYNNGQVIDFGMPCPTNCPPGNASNPFLN